MSLRVVTGRLMVPAVAIDLITYRITNPLRPAVVKPPPVAEPLTSSNHVGDQRSEAKVR